MPTISEKIKRALADIEVVRKSLDAVDRDHAEAEAVKRTLEATQAQLTETQARLENSKAELVKANAEHSRWHEVIAKQQQNGNARIDQLNATLQALERQIAEAETRHRNIISGIQALQQRLKV
jgi:chromosome segregation ATPase